MGYSFSYDGTIEDDDKPTVNTIINGEEVGETDAGLVRLDPGGYYKIGLKASFDTNSPILHVTAYELIYHPLDNITSIRDIIPESLVGSFSDSPPQSNELGCVAPGDGGDGSSGAISHLRESTGTFLLLPMVFVLYALR